MLTFESGRGSAHGVGVEHSWRRYSCLSLKFPRFNGSMT
jgi:hypothetical protein